MKKTKNNENNAFVIAIIGSSILSVLSIIYLLCYPNNFIRSNITIFKSNAITYAFSLFLSLCIFFILFLIFKKLNISFLNNKASKSSYFIAIFFLFALLLMLFNNKFFERMNEFGYAVTGINILSQGIGIFIFSILVFIGVYIYIYNIRISKNLVNSIYVLIAIITFINCLYLNISNADVYHGTAYTESIFNVLYNQPFTIDNSSVYGHYALMYAPIIKLFNGRSIFLYVVIAILSAVTSLLCFAIISKLTNNNYIKLLCGIFCNVSLLSIRQTNYWQIQPHRVLFPLILIAFILYFEINIEKPNRNLYIGYIICTLSIIWNTEIGIICCFSYSMYLVYKNIQIYIITSKEFALNIIKYLFLATISFVSSLLIIYIYNVFCGYYDFSLKTMLFPLLDNTYVVDELQYNMQFGNYSWIYLLFISFVSLFVSLKELVVFSENSNNNFRINIILFFVSVLNLIIFVYYANRAVFYNIDICIQTTGILLCILHEKIFTNRKNNFEKNTNISLLYLISSVSIIMMILSVNTDAIVFYKNFNSRLLAIKQDINYTEEVTKQIRENIPKDTYAFGFGVSSLYCELDWDTKCYHRDFADVYIGTNGESESLIINKIVEEILNEEGFVVIISNDDRNINLQSKEIVSKVLETCPFYKQVYKIDKIGNTGDFSLIYYRK